MSEPIEQIAQDQMPSLLLPLGEKYLLLPNVSVAEILLSGEPDELDGAPAWVLGAFKWRGLTVPLISFARLNGDGSGPHSIERVAVVNGITGRESLPFYAVAIEGVPRQMRVLADEIAIDEQAEPGAAELSRVRVGGEIAAIPDLAFIEERLASLGL